MATWEEIKAQRKQKTWSEIKKDRGLLPSNALVGADKDKAISDYTQFSNAMKSQPKVVDTPKQAPLATMSGARLADTKPMTRTEKPYTSYRYTDPANLQKPTEKISNSNLATLSGARLADQNIQKEQQPSSAYRKPRFDLFQSSKDKTGRTFVTDVKEAIAGTGKALVAGASDVNKGIINLPRLLHTGVSTLGAKAQGKDFKGDAITDFLGSQVEREEKVGEAYGYKGDNPALRTISGAIRAVPQVAPMLAGLSKGQGLGLIGAQSGGGGARDIEQQGGNIGQQILGGVAKAGVEIATEAPALGTMIDILGGKAGLKQIGKQAMEEFFGEGIAEALNPFIDSAVLNKELELATAGQIIEAGITGSLSALITGGTSAGIQQATRTLKNPSKANIELLAREVEAKTGQKITDLQIQQMVQESKNVATPKFDLAQDTFAQSTEQVEQTVQESPPTTIDTFKEVMTAKGVVGDKLLDSVDTFEDLDSVGTSVNPDGTVTLYHHTNADNAKQIVNTQQMKGKEDGIFFTTKKDGQAEGFGDTIVSVNVPVNELVLDDQFQDELHYKIPTDKIGDSISVNNATVAQANTITPTDTTKAPVEATAQPQTQPETTMPTLKSKTMAASIEDGGASMVISTLETDIQDMINTGEIDSTMLKKHQKSLVELKAKGVTKATTQEFKKLMAIKDSIAQLKEKHKVALKTQKENQVAKQEAKKERVLQSKERKSLVENIKKIGKGELIPQMSKIGKSLIADIDAGKPINQEMFAMMEATDEAIKSIDKRNADIEKGLIEGEVVEINDDIRASVERLSKINVKDMDIQEVRDLLEITNHIIHMSDTSIKEGAIQLKRDMKETKKGLLTETSTKKDRLDKTTGKTKEIGLGESVSGYFQGIRNTTPRNIFLEDGNGRTDSEFYKLFDEQLRRPQNKYLENKQKLTDIIASKAEDYDKITTHKDWDKVQDVNGLQLSSDDKVWLKRAVMNKNMRESIEKKGYDQDGTVTRITKDQVDKIKLTKDEQKIFDVLGEYFDTTYDFMNEAFLKKYGYELAKEENYLTKKAVRKDGSAMEAEEILNGMFQDAANANTGSAIARTGAINVVKMEGIKNVVRRQGEVAAKYNAYLNSMGYLEGTLFSTEVTEQLAKKYGKDKGEGIQTKIFRKLQKDMLQQDHTDLGVAENLFGKVRSNAIGSIFGLNPKIVMKQLPSYFASQGEISEVNLLKGLTSKTNLQEMWDNSARGRYRLESGFERDIQGFKGAMSKTTAGIRKADTLVTLHLWEATKRQVMQDNPKLKGQEFLDAVSKKFDDVLDSQPNFTPLERSDTMRQKGEMSKVLTAFGSARSAAVNEVRRGYIVGKNTGDWSYMKQKVSGFIQSQIGLVAVGLLFNKLRKRDEEPTMTALQSVMGSIQGLDIVSSLMKGFAPNSMGLSEFEKFTDNLGRIASVTEKLVKSELVTDRAIKKLLKDDKISNSQADRLLKADNEKRKEIVEDLGVYEVTEKQLVDALNNMADSLGTAFGVPIKNAKQIVQDVLNIPGAFGKGLLEVPALKYKQFTDPFTRTQYYDEAARIIESGNEKLLLPLLRQAEDIDTGVTIKQLKTNLKKRLDDENYKKILPSLKRQNLK